MKTNKNLSSLLSQIIYRYTIVSTLFITIVVISLFYFFNISITSRLLSEYESSKLELMINDSTHEADYINQALEDIDTHLTLLKNNLNNFFENEDTFSTEFLDAEFTVHESGALYKSKDNGGSGLYYSNVQPITEEDIEKALKTEWFDLVFREVTNNNNLIVQSYFNSHDSMNRLYPFMEDPVSVYGPDMDIPDYNFYYDADSEHNPYRLNVWLESYYDPAGQGWIISVIAPVYNGDFLEGVVGIDVTLNQLSSQILKNYDNRGFGALLVSSSGHIVAYNNHAEGLLSLNPLVDLETGPVEEVVMVPESYNLVEIVDDLKVSSLMDKSLYTDISISGVPNIVTVNKLEEADWYFVSIIDQNTFNNDRLLIEEETKRTLYILLIILLCLTALITFFFHSQAKRFSTRISRPVINIAELAKNFGVESLDVQKPEPVNIVEIDSLGEEFYLMANQIRNRTDQLIESEIEKTRAEETIEKHLKDSITDALTNIYNRRKFDDDLDKELQRSIRYQTDFSLIMLDIDYFKEINDTHGHAVGDDVLIHVAEIISGCIRKTDILARWGGDEFIILACETKEAEAKGLALKVKGAIEKSVTKGISVTSSIGVTQVNTGSDNVRNILSRADKALYQAKKLGRNCVVGFEEIEGKE